MSALHNKALTYNVDPAVSIGPNPAQITYSQGSSGEESELPSNSTVAVNESNARTPNAAVSLEQLNSVRFGQLVKQWHQQRGFSSSQDEIASCPAYHGLLAMGEHVVPLIMDQLKNDVRDHWFRILELVTSQQPVRHEDRGDYSKMRTAWLDWWDA